MFRTIGAFRDPRMWGVLAVAIVLRLLFEWGWGSHVERTIEEREARLSTLSPEDRMEAELRTWGAISDEVLGMDVEDDVEQVIRETRETRSELQRTLDESRYRPLPADRFDPVALSPAPPIAGPVPGGLVLGADGAVVKSPMSVAAAERQGALVPAWAVAGAAGGLIAVAGAVVSLALLRRAEADEAEPGATEG